ncbi:MAG: hypothetical protein OHK93_007107 [Ramalina farinacea]|uniref:ABC transporter domain-containing protein n=1 Tax=Ramalina farinacea TaxID=258253 RepID=A0AA43QM21_9LECA|nr:hypothetical protein [Ramalina farinacea]
MSWIAGPILFAAITLSTISIYEGGISPSTTFTALAIFQRLEGTLSIVPGLVTDFFDAWVSFDRIEQFLFSPERTDTTVDAELIAFEGACIAWPSDEGIPRQPTLHSLDFKFPRNELSIIAGPTGVGKSLLLAAMIGEADLLSGTIRRPRLDLSFQGQGIELSSKQWIIPKAISFVAQTPWIEGASLRDNILFGLPLSESRYTLVLQACALIQDIAAMEDRDKTELGAHGISLSGGQRSRLALARALYSRAEVLIIDDIFSSVDAHVGRHLLDHALTGDLAKDRTLIVATHHIELCLSRASFVVMLNKGTADYAGETEPLLRETDILVDDRGTQDGLDHSEYEAPLHTDSAQSSASLSDDSSISLNDPRSFASSSQKENGINVYTCTDKIRTNTEAKRLIQEEQHQSGRTKFYVYTEYLRAASAWPWVYWVIVVTLLVG